MGRSWLFRLWKSQNWRFLTSSSGWDSPRLTSSGEQKLTEILKARFPRATDVTVVDISGGCGAMYEISVESLDFKGKSRVQQHRMVNEALKEEIKDMHGLRISTSLPEDKPS